MSHPRIRIIRHEAIPKRGSIEVRFADGRQSKFFYWDDVLGRRLRPDEQEQEQGQGVCERDERVKG